MIDHPFTVPELLERATELWPERNALERSDATMTYRELDAASDLMARRLAALGVGRADRVCVHLNTPFDEVTAVFAIARLGAVLVDIASLASLKQVLHAVEDSESRVVLVNPRNARKLSAMDRPDVLEHVLLAGSRRSDFGTELEEIEPVAGPVDARVTGADLAALMYTSGSTGRPKGVMLDHQMIVQGARSVSSYIGVTSDDVILGALTLSFDYGMNQLQSAVLMGATYVTLASAIPAEMAATIERHGVTGFAGVPPMWMQMVRHLRDHNLQLPSVRFVTNSGGVVPPDVLDWWPKVFPNARPFLMYGLTEGFRSSYVPPERYHDKIGSMGLAIPDVELFVVDDERGVICGPGEHGELVHRSASLMSRGYWKSPELTAERFRPSPALASLIGDEPVLYSGDTVYADEEGYLWFVTRRSSLIKSSSIRISPTEVEEIVHETGLVSDVVAYGYPDDELGEVVGIAITVENTDDFDPDALVTECKAQMAAYMLPRHVVVWPEPTFPRTGNGKVDRTKVAARAIETPSATD